MNAGRAALGLEDTRYANPIGLDDPATTRAPRDLVDAGARLRRDPLFRRIFDTPADGAANGAHPRDIVNRNNLVRTVPWVNGVKTGYTLDAGNVLVASGTPQRGRR